jgi:hypothetical protein
MRGVHTMSAKRGLDYFRPLKDRLSVDDEVCSKGKAAGEFSTSLRQLPRRRLPSAHVIAGNRVVASVSSAIRCWKPGKFDRQGVRICCCRIRRRCDTIHPSVPLNYVTTCRRFHRLCGHLRLSVETPDRLSSLAMNSFDTAIHLHSCSKE